MYIPFLTGASQREREGGETGRGDTERGREGRQREGQGGETERETYIQTDRQRYRKGQRETDRVRDRDRQRDCIYFCLSHRYIKCKSTYINLVFSSLSLNIF